MLANMQLPCGVCNKVKKTAGKEANKVQFWRQKARRGSRLCDLDWIIRIIVFEKMMFKLKSERSHYQPTQKTKEMQFQAEGIAGVRRS